jgi:ribosomal protein L11 methyltransferase
LRGARESFGFDIDSAAIPYARELAERNEVAARCTWRTGGFEVLAERDGPFDGLCANLFADVIEAHAAELARVLAPRGWFAVSGCLAAKREATLTALLAAGLAVRDVRTRGRWDTYVGRRAEAR